MSIAKMIVQAMTTSEVSYKLRLELGPQCDWEQRLADMRRGRYADMPNLRPIAGYKHKGRVVYWVRAVDRFIEEMRKLLDSPMRNQAPETIHAPAPAVYAHLIKAS